MEQLRSLDQQIIGGLEKVDASRNFAHADLWLTFYLSGPEHGLAEVAEILADQGWSNVGGWKTAFIYPKRRVRKAAPGILQLAHDVQTLCNAHGVAILNIDADTSSDVQQSTFIPLFHSSA
jgi:hypothetical protein